MRKKITIEMLGLVKKINSICDEQCQYKSKKLWKLNASGKYIREQRLKYLRKKRDELDKDLPLVCMTEAKGKINKSDIKTFKIKLDGGASNKSVKYIWDIIDELLIKYPNSKFIKNASLLYYPDSMFNYDIDYSSQGLRNYIIEASLESEIDYAMSLFEKKHIETLIINEDKWLNKEYVLKETKHTRLKENVAPNPFANWIFGNPDDK